MWLLVRLEMSRKDQRCWKIVHILFVHTNAAIRISRPFFYHVTHAIFWSLECNREGRLEYNIHGNRSQGMYEFRDGIAMLMLQLNSGMSSG